MSTEFKNLYEELERNKSNHEKGDYNCIPFTGMERLERFLPGVEHKTYTIITASSGVKEKI